MTNELHPDDFDGDDFDGDDGDIVTLVRSAGLDTDPTFVSDLRATLLAEADAPIETGAGMIALTSSEPDATDTPIHARRGRRRPVLAAAAAVVVLGIAAIALVAQRGDDSSVITEDPPQTGNTIDDPVAFLDGETWVAVRRFDEFPSSRTPVFRTESDGAILLIDGSDGCRPVSLEVTFDGGTVASVAGAPSEQCDDDQATPYVWTIGDRLDESADGRFVIVRNDEALIEFSATADLPRASRDDLVGNWILDRQRGVEVGEGWRGPFAGLCLRLTAYDWSIDDGRLRIDGLADDFELACASRESEFFPDGEYDVLRVLADDGATALRIGDGIVLTDGERASRMWRLPVATTDPTGLVVSGSAAFGVQTDIGVGADDVIAAVSPVLGDPTYDSGWIDPEPSFRAYVCSEGLNEYRELWWDDLSFGIWRRGGRVSLQYWHVGDRGDLPFQLPLVDRPDAPAASGLRTEANLGLGDPVEPVIGPASRRRDGVDPSTYQVVDVISNIGAGSYYVIDGVIVGFGAVNYGC